MRLRQFPRRFGQLHKRWCSSPHRLVGRFGQALRLHKRIANRLHFDCQIVRALLVAQNQNKGDEQSQAQDQDQDALHSGQPDGTKQRDRNAWNIVNPVRGSGAGQRGGVFRRNDGLAIVRKKRQDRFLKLRSFPTLTRIFRRMWNGISRCHEHLPPFLHQCPERHRSRPAPRDLLPAKYLICRPSSVF